MRKGAIMADIAARTCGGFLLLNGETQAGEDWLADHLDPNTERVAGEYITEFRYGVRILDAAHADGLSVGRTDPRARL